MPKYTNNAMIILKESFNKTIEINTFLSNKTLYNKTSLNLSTLLFESQFVLNIHLQPLDFGPSGNRTRSQMSCILWFYLYHQSTFEI